MTLRWVVFGGVGAVALIVLAGAALLPGEARKEPPATLDALTTKRMECPDWRVRYCLAAMNDRYGTASDRTVLERLIRDGNKRVGGQAAVAYLMAFVRVDLEYLRENVELYYRLPAGVTFHEPPDITSVAFHRSMLGSDTTQPAISPSLQVIGLIGSKEDAKALRPFAASENPYVAKTAAVALIRLGCADEGIGALLEIVARPISAAAIAHQIDSLRLLGEADSESFHRLLPAFAKRVTNHECTVPRHWWGLTRVAWIHGREVN